MEVFRYKIIIIIFAFSINLASNESNKSTTKHDIATCPFTKIIEDIFKIHNRSSDSSYILRDRERVKHFLSSITNVRTDGNTSNIDNQEELVNKIIDSINKIKDNITQNKNASEDNLNEAIILSVPKQSENKDSKVSTAETQSKKVPIRSGIEDKIDAIKTQNDYMSNKTGDTNTTTSTSTERVNYVEILTIEPNNTHSSNTASHNIIDVLKHLMPLFNSTLTKELHNITIIERNHHKNHSFTATKNVSTIVVTYCDKENLTKANLSNIETVTKKYPKKEESGFDDYYADNSEDSDENDDDIEYEESKPDANVTGDENKDIMEAAEYGMQKMHELYSVLEPKLYSMGLWLDDTNPARYVAAFNAPAEEAARFSRFGYASLQAATRFKQLASRVKTNRARLASHARASCSRAVAPEANLKSCERDSPAKMSRTVPNLGVLPPDLGARCVKTDFLGAESSWGFF
ncbi:hypothetical protein evm_005777 [Chilo suppressalis]|nr:hypothetical protein evm_005777 [Chilo suppressalis]